MPEPMFRFLMTAGSEWDTPVIGAAIVRPPIPGADVYDLRKIHHTETRKLGNTETPFLNARCHDPFEKELFRASVIPCFRDEHVITGSNNWAVDGAHSASGAALVANDMHLAINVPIIWYRASLAFPNPSQPDTTERITGVTLPGLPSIVVGSNGHVAWGFTNSGGDWSDLVRIDPDPRDPSRYLTPDGPKPFETFSERSRPRARRRKRCRCAGRCGDRWFGKTRRAGVRAAVDRARRASARVGRDPAGARAQRRRADRRRRRSRHSEPERHRRRLERPHRVDDRRRHPAPRRPRRLDAGVVGRWHAALGRLPRRCRVPAHHRSGGRPHLDRQRAGRRRRHAGHDRRRRIRRRRAGTADSRSADGHRQGDAEGHARHPARRQGAVPGSLADAGPGDTAKA